MNPLSPNVFTTMADYNITPVPDRCTDGNLILMQERII